MMNHSLAPYAFSQEWNLLFGIAIAIALLVWGWAIYATIRYWTEIPLWVQIISVIGLVTNMLGGPILTIFLIYVTKSK